MAEEDAWPARLASALGAEIEVTTIAQTGWTASELLEAIAAADPDPPFDLLSLQVGVNDQYRGLSVDDYAADLRRLLECAVGLADGRTDRVLVLSIPDWTVTPHGAERDRRAETKALDGFNGRLCDEVSIAGCRWVDVTVLSRRAGEDPDLLAEDGLHPSAEMYRQWVGLLTPMVGPMLMIG